MITWWYWAKILLLKYWWYLAPYFFSAELHSNDANCSQYLAEIEIWMKTKWLKLSLDKIEAMLFSRRKYFGEVTTKKLTDVLTPCEFLKCSWIQSIGQALQCLAVSASEEGVCRASQICLVWITTQSTAWPFHKIFTRMQKEIIQAMERWAGHFTKEIWRIFKDKNQECKGKQWPVPGEGA